MPIRRPERFSLALYRIASDHLDTKCHRLDQTWYVPDPLAPGSSEGGADLGTVGPDEPLGAVELFLEEPRLDWFWWPLRVLNCEFCAALYGSSCVVSELISSPRGVYHTENSETK